MGNEAGEDGLVTLDDDDFESRGGGDGLRPTTTKSPKRVSVRKIVGIACLALAVAVAAVCAVAAISAAPSQDDGGGSVEDPAPTLATPASTLAGAITIARLTTHLEEFEKIAAQFSNSRSIENGHNASVDYVVGVLRDRAPSLRVWTQPFQVDMYRTVLPPAFAVVAPYVPAIDFALGTDFRPFHGFVGAANVTAAIGVPAGCDLGCNATDFAGFVPGRIALIKRGDCAFDTKVGHAVRAGAAGALIYNDGASADRVGTFRGRLATQPVPAFALAYSLGALLLAPGSAVRMAEAAEAYKVTTLNVFAETPGGDSRSVVVVGTHLDSVPEGPGINDNGSGSAANLEMAVAVHRLGRAIGLKNSVRFAWWGAEEIGLLGSRYYVSHLNATNRTALECIALNLDYDMLGSPNYHLGVYDGRNAAVASVRNASGTIQDIFTRYFDEHGYRDAWDLGAFDGRSDYAPFTEAGVPAGGIYAGAEKTKTAAQRTAVGGLAGVPFDPCYHQSCDTVENVNTECFELMAKAAAHALQKVATQAHLRTWLGGSLGSVKIA